jgi:hypothetical protein
LPNSVPIWEALLAQLERVTEYYMLTTRCNRYHSTTQQLRPGSGVGEDGDDAVGDGVAPLLKA